MKHIPCKIGQVRLHIKSNRIVFISSGQYQVNGRISNFWYYRFINPTTGIVSNRDSGCDYDNGAFGKVIKAKIETKVTVKK